MRTFLFYDIESTGLNVAFDQVLQFAAIRTDESFQILKRYEILVKLRPDVIPSPHALIVHHIGVKSTERGINELEAIQEIHSLLNEPGTISLGYNTLNFDDEFLRFAFYHNLLSPYSHQFANQCGRMDLFPLTLAFWLYNPSILEPWPTIDGKISLKLENLNACHQLAKGPAHDAMVDVEATLNLAKKLSVSTEMWKYLLGYFDKNLEQQRFFQLPIAFVSTLMTHREGIMLNSRFGYKKNMQAPVLQLGQHKHYKNQSLWLILDQKLPEDPSEAWVIKKKPVDGLFILPPKARYLSHIDEARQKQAEENRRRLQEDPNFLTRLVEYHQEAKYPIIPDLDIDAALYQQSFFTQTDLSAFRKFHQASPVDKLAQAYQFSNPDFTEMAIRLLGRHYPEVLSEEERQVFKAYLAKIKGTTERLDHRGKAHLTPLAALEDIKSLEKQDLSGEQANLLRELKEYLQTAFGPY